MTRSASETAGYWSASESRRALTLLRFWASFRILVAVIGYLISHYVVSTNDTQASIESRGMPACAFGEG